MSRQTDYEEWLAAVPTQDKPPKRAIACRPTCILQPDRWVRVQSERYASRWVVFCGRCGRWVGYRIKG